MKISKFKGVIGLLISLTLALAIHLLETPDSPNPSNFKKKPHYSQKEDKAPARSNVPIHRQRIQTPHVIDGDTLTVFIDGEKEHLRLIGIDCPEAQRNEKAERDAERLGLKVSELLKFGVMSKQNTIDLVNRSKEFSIEYDQEKRDRFGRLLGYLYLEDGEMLNRRIVKDGFARPMTIKPNIRYADIIHEEAKNAALKGAGLWSNRVSPLK